MSPQAIPREAKLDVLNLPGVVSVGESTRNGNIVAVVTVDSHQPDAADGVPATIAGFDVVIEYDGPAQPDVAVERRAVPEEVTDQNRKARYRPVQPGISTSHADFGTALTLSFPFTSGSTDWLTTNHHGWREGGPGEEGSDVIQPGRLDGGDSNQDVIGQLDGWNNSLDVAFAYVDDDVDYEIGIYNLGPPTGVRAPESGMGVTKSGRTTGVTSGEVLETNIVVSDPNGNAMEATAKATYTSDGGDSGSPVVDDAGNAVGIHWGSFTESGRTLFTDVTAIEDWSGVEVITEDMFDPNEPPEAAFNTSTDGLTVEVDASPSSDDDAVVSYEWDFGDGGTASGRTATHTYVSGGAYTVTLTVSDAEGETGEATRTVRVTDPNSPPSAAFTSSVDGANISVDAAGSADPDGQIVTYSWDIGGASYDGPTAEHTFETAGTYEVALTVVDDRGATDQASESVEIEIPDEECTYEGYPRSQYEYTGENTSAFRAWQNCEITTSDFQWQTGKGDGTGALVRPREGPGPATVLILAAVAGAAYLSRQ